MKKCTEINELLSAYSDGELKDSDRLSVEDHLAGCESCSALLEIYKEISTSVDESNVPVPDALRIGVMNMIRSESISSESSSNESFSPVKENVKKKWWQHQVLMTRLAPIAACLAVVLLVWQFGGNMIENLYGATNDSAPEAAGMPPPADAPETASGGDINRQLSDDDGALEETSSIFPFDAAGVDDEYDSFAEPAIAQPGSRRDDFESEEINDWFLDIVKHAYAEIEIVGAFPAILAEYGPPLGPWQEWQLVFEIPSSDVDGFMETLINRAGVSITRNHHNQNSTYAIVFYSGSR